MSDYPELLDIVKIDGRWAQVRLGGGVLRFLDDGNWGNIDWNDYSLVKSYDKVKVKDMKKMTGESLTDAEIENIRRKPEEDQDPKWKVEVYVFGEYVKNNQ